MENKGLLKLPETWFVVVTESNKVVLEKWFKIKYPDYELYCKNVGIYKWKKGSKTIIGQSDDIINQSFDFGQQITFADFKRLVLGEKNADDYGVVGCEEFKTYANKNKIGFLGKYSFWTYSFDGEIWISEDSDLTTRQTLPLEEYLKLIESENMEKKYEYKLRDEKYSESILKLIDRKIDFTFPLREEVVPNTITILRDLNVLDLFFEKIEVKEDKITIIDKQCVNSKFGASWLDGGCECGFKCKVKVEVERNGHNPYIYILDEKEYKTLLNK